MIEIMSCVFACILKSVVDLRLTLYAVSMKLVWPPHVERMTFRINELTILRRSMLLLLNFQRGLSTFVHFVY